MLVFAPGEDDKLSACFRARSPSLAASLPVENREPSASSGLLAFSFIMWQTRGNSGDQGIRQPGLGSLFVFAGTRGLCVGPALSSQGGGTPAELPPPKTSQPAHVRPFLFASAPGSFCGRVAPCSLTCDYCSLFSESQSSLVSNRRSFLDQAPGIALHF